MKKYILGCLCVPVLCFAQNQDTPPPPIEAPVIPHASDDKMAVQWRNVFTHLVQQQQWQQASYIAKIGEEHFQTQPFWQGADFQKTWHAYQINHAARMWSFQSMAMFRNAQDNETVVGFQQEMDGSWWLVVQSKEGFHCNTSCVVQIETPSRTIQLNARPPVAAGSARSMGMLLPISLISNQQQQWIIHTPNREPIIVDVSYARSLCQSKLQRCF